MSMVNRVLIALTTVVVQFALGHILGFGTSLLTSAEWSAAVIPLGNALGVTIAGLIALRLRTGADAGWLAALPWSLGAALGGSAAGMVWISVLPPYGYMSLLLPLTLAIVGFHADRALRREVPEAAPLTH
jgi:hypothetical protein